MTQVSIFSTGSHPPHAIFSYVSLSNMVQIKISASAVFILSAAAIVTVPVAPLLVEQLEQGVLRPRVFKLWPNKANKTYQV